MSGTCTIAPTTPQELALNRIYTGGNEYTDTLGQFWTADHYYTTSARRTRPPTPSAPRWTSCTRLGYWWAGRPGVVLCLLATAKTYRVRLHFAEILFTQLGRRVFDVAAEGRTVLAGYDIFARVGPNPDELQMEIWP